MVSASLRSKIEEQYARLLGDPGSVYWFDGVDGVRVEVWVWPGEKSDDHDTTVFATVGAFEALDASRHRCEFHLGLGGSVPTDEVADALATFAFEGMGDRRIPHAGQCLTRRAPLWPGTDMMSLLVLDHPEASPPMIRFEDIVVEFYRNLPIWPDELTFIKEAGFDAFLHKLASNTGDVLNPYRASLIQPE